MFTRPDPEHPTRKLYLCQFCPRLFRKPSALQTHIYSHTGEKPFACDKHNCSRSYSTLSNLRRHFKAHKKLGGSSSFIGLFNKHQHSLRPVATENTDYGFHHNNNNMTMARPTTAPTATANHVVSISPSLSAFLQTSAAVGCSLPSTPKSLGPAFKLSLESVATAVVTDAHGRALATVPVTPDPPLFGGEEWFSAMLFSTDYSDFIFTNHNKWI